MTNGPVDSQIFVDLFEIWVFFEPDFLYDRVEKGQNTPRPKGSILATFWSWETTEPILETRNVGLQHM